MRDKILTILGKIWREELTPEQVINLMRAGPFNLIKEKKEKALEILSALKGGEITTDEAKEWLEEEGIYGNNPRKIQNLCQIN